MTMPKPITRRFYVWQKAYVDHRRDSVKVLASSAREAARVAGYDIAVSDCCFNDQTLFVFNSNWRPRGTFRWTMDDRGGSVDRLRSDRVAAA